jgi:hypothetical protein
MNLLELQVLVVVSRMPVGDDAQAPAANLQPTGPQSASPESAEPPAQPSAVSKPPA